MNNKWMWFFLLLMGITVSCSEKLDDVVSKEPLAKRVKPKTVLMEVFGEQFKWTIRYSGEDNQLGKFDYKLTNEENPLGLMTTESIETSLAEFEKELQTMDSISLHAEVTEEFMKKYHNHEKFVLLLKQMRDKHDSSIDKLAQDDLIISDTMVLCVDQEYEFHFRSKDVIHAAYFPHFRAQMNTVPGMTTRFKFTPTETSIERRKKSKDDNFEFILTCNKVCGAGHESMKMVLRVVEKNEYDLWIKSNESNLFKNRTVS